MKKLFEKIKKLFKKAQPSIQAIISCYNTIKKAIDEIKAFKKWI